MRDGFSFDPGAATGGAAGGGAACASAAVPKLKAQAAIAIRLKDRKRRACMRLSSTKNYTVKIMPDGIEFGHIKMHGVARAY